MTDVSASNPAVYDPVKSTVKQGCLATEFKQSTCKSSTSSRQDLTGVSHQVSNKHKNFKRRDTPMTLGSGEKQKNTFKPNIEQETLEEE